jgi:hypothetical protein
MAETAVHKTTPAASAKPTERPSLWRWLIGPLPRQFLLPLTGLWILGLDWLLFSQDLLTVGLAMPVLVVLGFLLGGGGAFFIQRRFAGDAPWKGLFKAILAGIVVGIPLPLAGTVIGGWIVLASGLGGLLSRSAKS